MHVKKASCGLSRKAVANADIVATVLEISDCRQHVCCRIERRQQFVTRRVRLPESADMSKITAKMDNGTLVIDVPKNPDKVRQRQIDVS